MWSLPFEPARITSWIIFRFYPLNKTVDTLSWPHKLAQIFNKRRSTIWQKSPGHQQIGGQTFFLFSHFLLDKVLGDYVNSLSRLRQTRKPSKISVSGSCWGVNTSLPKIKNISRKEELLSTRFNYARQLADKHKITQQLAYNLTTDLLNLIVEDLKSGQNVTLQDFGSFRPRITPAHRKLSYITNEVHEVPDKRKISFKPSLRLQTV